MAKTVKELKELLDLPLAILQVVKQAKADGKVDLNDAALLLQLVPTVGPAMDGVSEVPAELADLSAEEAAEVISHVMSKLSLDNAKAGQVVEKSLKVLAAAYELYKAATAPTV